MSDLKNLGDLLEQHGWAELTDERFSAFQRLRYLLGIRDGSNKAIAIALRSGALAAAPAPSIVDMAGGVLAVVALLAVILCMPAIVACILRAIGWRRLERRQRAEIDGVVRSEFAAFRERWRRPR